MLAPVAWRTPPRHYGPWEPVASLLTEGLVARGVDVTLFATLDSVDRRRPGRRLPARLRRGCRRWTAGSGRRCTSSHALARSGEFDLVHNQLDWLPLAFGQHARAPMVTTIHGFSGPGILPAYTAVALGVRRDLGLRPAARTSTTSRRSITASTSARCRFGAVPASDWWSFGRVHPDKGTADAIAIARRAGRRLVICGIVQDERYFAEAGRAAHRR